MGHTLLVGGGIIPADDMTALEEGGYARLFGPGSRTEDIANWIDTEMNRRWATEGDN
jgi:methylmalonyl-CoA mutase C-terminal domain/subunit